MQAWGRTCTLHSERPQLRFKLGIFFLYSAAHDGALTAAFLRDETEVPCFSDASSKPLLCLGEKKLQFSKVEYSCTITLKNVN